MILVGVDEAGRGCLLGNVVAGAVILPERFSLPGLTDSKKISEKKRAILFQKITQISHYAVGMASPSEIDSLNILQATMLAMKRAIKGLNIAYDQVLVDGNVCPAVLNCTAIIKGDLTQPVISAASIIAKVTRDRQMIELDKQYPNYGFAQHKGYATKIHLDALNQFGTIAHLYRHSFAPIKNNNR